VILFSSALVQNYPQHTRQPNLPPQQMPNRCISMLSIRIIFPQELGCWLLSAADLRDQGYGAAEIAARVGDLIPKVRTSFIIDTLDYLHLGGRCSAMQSIVGSYASDQACD
jgi:fatty acid-binding protein DegV